MLTAISRGAGSAATIRHLRPAGKPAPPRPPSAEASRALMSGSRSRLPALADYVEVVVERRDFEHLGLRQLHFLRKRGKVRCGQVAEAVLQLVQVLDQQVGAARRIAEQRANLCQRARIDRASLRFAAPLS